MARLFITEREIDFISDTTKEFIKDVVGQYVVYYPISVMKTNVDMVYDEATEKIFNNPIKIDALIGQPERENSFDKFGIYQNSGKVEVYIQIRDLLDKNINMSIGDYFVYGESTYEIMDIISVKNIYGQEDHQLGITVTGNMVAASQFDLQVFKKLWQDSQEFKNKDSNKIFEQQRGLSETEQEGATGDIRQMRQRLGDEMAPIALNEGPRKIIPDNVDQAIIDNPNLDETGNSFYNE